MNKAAIDEPPTERERMYALVEPKPVRGDGRAIYLLFREGRWFGPSTDVKEVRQWAEDFLRGGEQFLGNPPFARAKPGPAPAAPLLRLARGIAGLPAGWTVWEMVDEHGRSLLHMVHGPCGWEPGTFLTPEEAAGYALLLAADPSDLPIEEAPGDDISGRSMLDPN